MEQILALASVGSPEITILHRNRGITPGEPPPPPPGQDRSGSRAPKMISNVGYSWSKKLAMLARRLGSHPAQRLQQRDGRKGSAGICGTFRRRNRELAISNRLRKPVQVTSPTAATNSSA